ncbi:MAG: hypothetical protein CL910_18435 [Deltaproteobacteria bacterium]|jgi:glyoxylase-like metal-dependent hydrolase (beta-lactamase superfamily II)|nr:hypothetical protein [Deltaproteobacteria bacterium]
MGRAALLLTIAVLLTGCGDHRNLYLRLFGWLQEGEPPALEPASEEGPGVEWFDDYFTVEWIDDATVAIGEPRYFQQTWSYLILGSERALLFDSGPGERDIRPVVDSLTALPVIALPSHLHYDHVGNVHRFEQVGMIDLPYLRARAPDGVLLPTETEHLGYLEGRPLRPLHVTHWWAPGEEVDLGGRSLRLLHAPGHTRDSMALHDAERHQLFSGDYLYPAPLFAFLPNSSLGDYLWTADRLLEILAEDAVIWAGHRAAPPGAPRTGFGDVRDLQRTLLSIRAGEAEGEGLLPVEYRVNERISLLTDLPMAHRWEREAP